MRHLEKLCTVCGQSALPTDYGWVHVDGTDHGHAVAVEVTAEDLWIEDSEDTQALFDKLVSKET